MSKIMSNVVFLLFTGLYAVPAIAAIDSLGYKLTLEEPKEDSSIEVKIKINDEVKLLKDLSEQKLTGGDLVCLQQDDVRLLIKGVGENNYESILKTNMECKELPILAEKKKKGWWSMLVASASSLSQGEKTTSGIKRAIKSSGHVPKVYEIGDYIVMDYSEWENVLTKLEIVSRNSKGKEEIISSNSEFNDFKIIVSREFFKENYVYDLKFFTAPLFVEEISDWVKVWKNGDDLIVKAVDIK